MQAFFGLFPFDSFFWKLKAPLSRKKTCDKNPSLRFFWVPSLMTVATSYDVAIPTWVYFCQSSQYMGRVLEIVIDKPGKQDEGPPISIVHSQNAWSPPPPAQIHWQYIYICLASTGWKGVGLFFRICMFTCCDFALVCLLWTNVHYTLKSEWSIIAIRNENVMSGTIYHK